MGKERSSGRTLCSKAEEKCPTIFGLTDRLFWPFDDPAAAQGTVEEKLGVCRRIRDEIDEKLCAWLRENGIEPKAL
jgi:arsenate reductase